MLKYIGLTIFLTTFCSGQNDKVSFSDSISTYYFSNQNKSKFFAKKLLKGSLENENDEQVVWSLINLATLSSLQNQEDSVNYYFDKGINFARKNKNYNHEGRVLVNKISYYVNKREYDTASKLIEYTLRISKKITNQKTIGYVKQLKAYVLFELEMYEEAKSIYIENLKLELGQNFYLDNKLGMTRISLKLKNYKNFLQDVDQSIINSEKATLYDIKVYFMLLKANFFFIHNDIDSAQKIFDKIFKVLQKYGYPYINIYAEIEYSRFKIQSKKYNESLKLLDSIFKKYKKSEISLEYISEINYLYAESYKSLNNFKKSNYYFDQFVQSSEKIGRKKIEAIDGLRKIDINELKQKEMQSRRMRAIYLALIILLFVVLLILIFLKYKKDKVEKLKFDKLYQKIQLFEANKNSQGGIILEIINTNEFGDIKEEQTIKIEQEKLEELLINLKKIESKKIFLKQDFTLTYLAKKLKTNTAYLSKIINTELNKNFSSYVNDLRINYVIIELKNNVTIQPSN